jgi:hypothetical protein
MLRELDDYDWAEVFGEGGGGNCTAIDPFVTEGDLVGKETFSREDVESIRGQVEGKNDGPDWIVWGKLKDGRYFLAYAGCDYTGWDCQAGNYGAVASTEETLIRFGMTDDQRSRFGIAQPV